jgi:hypothetical protein
MKESRSESPTGWRSESPTAKQKDSPKGLPTAKPKESLKAKHSAKPKESLTAKPKATGIPKPTEKRFLKRKERLPYSRPPMRRTCRSR